MCYNGSDFCSEQHPNISAVWSKREYTIKRGHSFQRPSPCNKPFPTPCSLGSVPFGAMSEVAAVNSYNCAGHVLPAAIHDQLAGPPLAITVLHHARTDTTLPWSISWTRLLGAGMTEPVDSCHPCMVSLGRRGLKENARFNLGLFDGALFWPRPLLC